MSDITQTAGPNETAKELEEGRKNSIKEAFGMSKQEKTEKSEEKLDKDQKNSYIKDDGEGEEQPESDSKESSNEDKPEQSEDEVDDKYKEIFEKQFGKDGVKAAKSWSQAQKEYTKLREKLKKEQQITSTLEEIVSKNPKLGEMIKTARDKGELTEDDLQSFLQSDREPSGKPNTSSSESKLEIVDDELDIDSVDEKTLAQEGLLDLSKKELMTDSEWELSRRQAAVKYAQKHLPNKIANKAYKQFEQQIEDKKKQEEQEKQKQKIDELNSKRYRKGINRVIDEFGLDFAGNEDHKEALDEIEQRASTIRDHENPNVIRPNAIYLATLEMIEEGKLDVDKAQDVDRKAQEAKQKAEEDLEDKMGFNKSASSSKDAGENPDTLVGKLRQKRYQEYEDEIENRRKTDRLHTRDK